MTEGNNLHTESEEHKMKNAEARWPKTTTMEYLDEMRFGTSGAILRYGEQILVVGMELGLPRSHLRDGRNAGGDGLCGHRMPPEPRRIRHGAFRGRRARDGLVHEAHLRHAE